MKHTQITKNFILLFILMLSAVIYSQMKQLPNITSNKAPQKPAAVAVSIDTDGDGIIDSVDIDDDNDGIIDTLESQICRNAGGNCDADLDGIPNSLDLDSDNDGIPDVEEAGFRALSNGRSMMSAGLWIDRNNNGLHDNIEALIAAGNYIITDQDSVLDFADLDSDNDSLFDVDEAGECNSDGDINGDGIGDGADADGDGILDAFDNFLGFGTNTRPFAKNTLNAGSPDYQKTDADNDGIYDISHTLFARLDADNNGTIDGIADTDKDGILDAFDSNKTAAGSPRDIQGKLYVEFDGRNDYGDGEQLLSRLNQSTLMGWIKPGISNTDSFVMGQDNFNIAVKNGRRLTVTANGVTIICTVPMEFSRWYHVSAVYDATNSEEKLKLYVNGKKEMVSNDNALASGLTTSSARFTFAKMPTAATGFFKGAIDEIRVFNIALSDDMLQKMVYQEIKSNNGAIRGEVIPKDIENTSWSSLLAYYRMDTFKDDITDNYTTAAIDEGYNTAFAKIYNVKTMAVQLAPMPFVTTQSGAIDSAVSQNNFVNGNDAIANDWSIIRVRHSIDLPYNQTSLGMIIDSGATIIVGNENKIKNTWYLKLDGKIDLKGKSQLVQTESSELDPTSSGFIEKDQQGQTNIYNYNYWCSPVGAINNQTNNNDFTVNAVLRDATDAENLKNINWITGLNGAPTSPISLSNFWIYKYQNLDSNSGMANWSAVGANGNLHTGEGFTLKGAGASGALQNYTFVGKPNNGDIILPSIPTGDYHLIGNPYPSAIDADKFITDNLTATTGTLYFWEQYATNATHYQSDYQGGYATRTLVGGTPPLSPSGLGANGGSSNRIPGRFIPVGQAFLMIGCLNSGTVKFTNSQRAFIKETNPDSNMMFKGQNAISNTLNNSDDTIADDNFVKIRIGCDTPANYHRQLLLGFMNEKATNSYDMGYDAQSIDTQPYDMYFVSEGRNLTIQGVGYFNVDDSYPVAVKCQMEGNVRFTLDQTENLNDNQHVYIFDNLTQTYHDIRNENYEVTLPAGTTTGRFSLRFKDPLAVLATNGFDLDENILVVYTNENNAIRIKNNVPAATVETVMLFNIIGQPINSWNVKNEIQTKINIPVANLSVGTYIIKVHTTKGDLTKKVVIR